MCVFLGSRERKREIFCEQIIYQNNHIYSLYFINSLISHYFSLSLSLCLSLSLSLYIYIYIYARACVCVCGEYVYMCVCVCVKERERKWEIEREEYWQWLKSHLETICHIYLSIYLSIYVFMSVFVCRLIRICKYKCSPLVLDNLRVCALVCSMSISFSILECITHA